MSEISTPSEEIRPSKLGNVTYGPTALTLQIIRSAMVESAPTQVSAQVILIVFSTKDGAFQDLKVSSDFGYAFELGVDFPVDERFGMFIDAKKQFCTQKLPAHLTARQS